VYDAYGNLTDETNAAVDCLFGYTGRQFDEATGLQNNLNRWYDPKVGRWLSEDPIGFSGGDPNPLRYVGNAPTHATDPNGLAGGPAVGPASRRSLWQEFKEWWIDLWSYDYVNPDGSGARLLESQFTATTRRFIHGDLIPITEGILDVPRGIAGAGEFVWENTAGWVTMGPDEVMRANSARWKALKATGEMIGHWGEIPDWQARRVVTRGASSTAAGYGLGAGICKGLQAFRRVSPCPVGEATALDDFCARVVPSPAREIQTGQLLERTFNTPKGPVDMLAEIVVEGDRLTLKDIAVYGRGSEPLTGLTKDVLAARSELISEAKRLGFKQLRITGTRGLSSSSASPGKRVNIIIDLTKE